MKNNTIENNTSGEPFERKIYLSEEDNIKGWIDEDGRAKIKIVDCAGEFEISAPLEKIRKLVAEDLSEIIIEEKFKAMEDMALFLAHEIKNPFFALKNILLSVEIEDEEKKKQIKSLIERIETIIMNITIFIRGGNPQKKTENIESIVEDAISEINEISPSIFRFDFSIEKDYSSDRIFVIGDRFLLKRAFFNILINAVESVQGKTERKIKIRTYDKDSFIVCEFEDTGCGIPEEKIDKIFIPFFTTKVSGMGLGMSVVKKVIVDMHEGKIEVKSKEGKGTKVIVYIPSA